MGFSPRLINPSTTDKYWISTSSGGYNRCILITGNSVLPNCFAGNTEVLTSEGILKISDCTGRKLQVLTIDNTWRDAEFYCFGEQELWEVQLGKHTYRCTANHRWPIFSQHFKFKQFVTTDQLDSSMYIKYSMCTEIEYDEDLDAVRHGFIYGDGTVGYKDRFSLKSKKMIRQTHVKRVQPLGVVEPVYCAIEPVTHTFTLGGGELTGNCVGFAFGRFMEIMNTTSCKLSTNNAENWWGNVGDGYERGQTPRVGAVICWRKGQAGNSGDGAGHVAIVEQINSDGSILTSNSAYGGTRFYTKTLYPPNYVMGSSYAFQGFIYNPSVSSTPNKITEFINTAATHVSQDNAFVVSSVGISKNQSWSTSFIVACAAEVGVLNTCIPRVQDPGGFGRLGVPLGKGTWISGPYVGSAATPQSGDIMILRLRSNTNYIDKYSGDKSAIVKEVVGSVVHVIEGDCANIVQLKQYNINDSQISGYYRPAWSTVNGYVDNYITTGPLYATKNTSEDATIREVGYLSPSYKPSISSIGNIRLSAINYTSLLAAFFDSVVIRSDNKQAVITDGVTNQNAKVILDFLLGKGLSAAQAIGFLANIQQESGFNPAAVNSSSGASGICQWLGGRRTAMISFVGSNWKSNLTRQCEFLWSELHGSESKTLTRVMQEVTTNNEEGAKQATIIVLYQFERPGKSEAVEAKRCSNATTLWSQIVLQLL